MTRDADFKKLVRGRMATTGQNYSAARHDLLAATGQDPAGQAVRKPPADASSAFQRARLEQEKVVGRFFRDGRLNSMPMRRKVRAAVLLEFVRLFEPGRAYTEREVSDILATVHEDFAFWRRELVDYGYLTRGAGIYRLADRAPDRPESMRQEIPDWEAIWLPGFLAGRAD